MEEPSIAEREETIPSLNGMLIGIQDIVTARESSNKPDQSGFRKMEVRNQSINRLILEARIDEKLRIFSSGTELSVLMIDGFQSTSRSRTDRNDSPVLLLCEIEPVCRCLVPVNEFTVPIMLTNIVIFDRTESSKADIQSHIKDFNAFFL